MSEILEFVMGPGLIPADGEVWKMRRRTVVPALHKKYLAAMVGMFGECALHGSAMLEQSHKVGCSGEGGGGGQGAGGDGPGYRTRVSRNWGQVMNLGVCAAWLRHAGAVGQVVLWW